MAKDPDPRAILDHSLDIVIQQDHYGCIEYASASLTRVLGYDPAQWRGQPIHDFLHPGDLAATWDLVKSALDTGSDRMTSAVRLRHADGHWVWMEAVSNIMRDGGRITGIVSVLRDITERRHRESDLEIADLLARATGDGVFDWDLITGDFTLSARWKANLGYAPEAFPDAVEAFFDQIAPADRDETRADLRALADGARDAVQRVARFRHVDGRVLSFEIRAFLLRTPFGVPRRLVGTQRDLSYVVAIEDALRERDERLSQASALARMGCFVWDEVAHRCEFCTDELAALLDMTVADMLAFGGRHSLADRLEGEAARHYEAALVEARATGRPYDVEVSFRDRSGARRHLREVGRFELGPEGQALRAVGMIQDVTEARLREGELAASRDRLSTQTAELIALAADLTVARHAAETASRAKSQFLATMSHELRTPLNAILGFSEIIRDEILGPVSEPRYRDYAGDIHASGRHLLAILNDILDLAKIEAGRLDLQMGWIDLDEVVGEVLRLMRGPANERSLSLSAALSEGPSTICGDARAIKQILINLVSNAVKFTEPGGSVTLGGGPLDPERYALVVEDTGIGIAPELLARVFEPFEQVDNHYARQSGGTGLGLTLVKALVELHGGTVGIESQMGIGTRVTVSLPRGAPDIGQAAGF